MLEKIGKVEDFGVECVQRRWWRKRKRCTTKMRSQNRNQISPAGGPCVPSIVSRRRDIQIYLGLY
jgi:hypothetical protein